MLFFLLALILFAIIDIWLYAISEECSDSLYYLLPGGGILKYIVSLHRKVKRLCKKRHGKT